MRPRSWARPWKSSWTTSSARCAGSGSASSSLCPRPGGMPRDPADRRDHLWVIRERRASGHDPGDLLSRLLAARDEDGTGGMSDRQIRDEAVTIFIAGHETTALALFYTFYLLDRHPEVEAKLSEEIAHVLDRKTSHRGGRRQPPLHRVGRPRGHAALSARLGHRPRSPLGLRDWRLSRASGNADLPGPVPRPPRPEVVRRPEAFRPERWADDLIRRLPRCAVFPVRRRAADLHRQSLRDDGSRPRPGDDRPTASPRRSTRPDTRAVSLDHAPPEAGTSGPA